MAAYDAHFCLEGGPSKLRLGGGFPRVALLLAAYPCCRAEKTLVLGGAGLQPCNKRSRNE